MEFLDTFDSVTFIPFTTLNYVSLATIIEISLDLILLRVTVNEYRRETGVSSRPPRFSDPCISVSSTRLLLNCHLNLPPCSSLSERIYIRWLTRARRGAFVITVKERERERDAR